MYNGVNESKGNQPEFYTGLESFQFLGVNPTKEELEKWLGREVTWDLNYDTKVNTYDNQTIRPIQVWLKGETVEPMKFYLNIGNEPSVTANGNYQVITTSGQVVWAKESGKTEVKPEFANHRALVSGEADLITFVQRLLGWNKNSTGDFMGQMQDQKNDAASLFAGNYTKMNELAKWSIAEDKWVSLPLAVTEKEVQTESGSTILKKTQVIPFSSRNLSKVMFSGKVSDWAKGKFKETIEKESKDGRVFIKGDYTVDFMPFDKTKSLNNIPANPPGETEWKV